MAFGKEIKRIREASGITASSMVELIGIDSLVRYKAWEQKDNNPKFEDRKLIETFFGMDLDEVIKLNKIPDYLLTGEKNTTKVISKDTNTEKTIPYYPDINASAGLSFLMNNGHNYSVPITIPNVDAEAFINVFGDSMYPKFCSGEIIGIKTIEKDFVMFGQAYVIQMTDGEAYIKYIKKGKDDKHWILASENERYEPKEFNLSKIEKVFIIKAVITKTTLI